VRADWQEAFAAMVGVGNPVDRGVERVDGLQQGDERKVMAKAILNGKLNGYDNQLVTA
jgi:hypothetical protein